MPAFIKDMLVPFQRTDKFRKKRMGIPYKDPDFLLSYLEIIEQQKIQWIKSRG